MKLRHVNLIAILLSLSLIAAAQSKKPAPTTKAAEKPAAAQSAAPAMPPMPKPAPELGKVIKALSGNWSTAEEFPPQPMLPQGGGGKGTEVFKAGPGGYSLLADYKTKGAIGDFAGHMVVTWDSQNQTLVSHWLDSMSADELTQTGKWDGENLVFTSNSDVMGKMTYMKEVYSDIQPGSFTFNIDSSTEGGPMQHFMTIHYKRMQEKAAPAKSSTAASKP